MVTVYECSYSAEDDRPEIDFSDEFNKRNDWLKAGEVVDGTLPMEAYPPVIAVQVHHPHATEWDCYMDGGLGGLFSQRFVDVVGKEALRYFSLLPCALNGAPYFFLRCEQRIDCFDREHAVFDTFQHDPARIMLIRHYAFFDAQIPEGALFCIPENRRRLFTVEQVVQRIQDGQLKGVCTEIVP